MNQVDLAFIFANYALEAGIDTDKALLVEKGSDLYVEYLVARPDTSTIPAFRSWRKALNSDRVRSFISPAIKAKFCPVLIAGCSSAACGCRLISLTEPLS